MNLPCPHLPEDSTFLHVQHRKSIFCLSLRPSWPVIHRRFQYHSTAYSTQPRHKRRLLSLPGFDWKIPSDAMASEEWRQPIPPDTEQPQDIQITEPETRKKRPRPISRETELPQGFQIILASGTTLDCRDPETGDLTLAVVTGPDDAHVLRWPGYKVWPFVLLIWASAIMVTSIVGGLLGFLPLTVCLTAPFFVSPTSLRAAVSGLI
jgi:hypothetical protein